MSKFTDVSVVKAANIYFDGKVSSRTVEFGDGTFKTLGLMLPGEYEFGTSQPELMEITAGVLRYKLPESDQWQEVQAGGAFNVPGNVRFNVDVKEVTDYVCSYL